jgi:ribosomal protein L35
MPVKTSGGNRRPFERHDAHRRETTRNRLLSTACVVHDSNNRLHRQGVGGLIPPKPWVGKSTALSADAHAHPLIH